MLVRIVLGCAAASIGVLIAAYNVFYLTVLEAAVVAILFFVVTSFIMSTASCLFGIVFAFRRRSLRIGAEIISLVIIGIVTFGVAIFIFDSILDYCKIDDLRDWYCR